MCEWVYECGRDIGPGESVRLRRDAVLFWRLMVGADGRVGAGAVMPMTEVAAPLEPATAVWLRELVFEYVRWCWRPAVDGMEKPDPERRGCVLSETRGGSAAPEAPAEVDDVFDTTEAFCAARNSESSRVRRFTCQRKS